MPIAEAPPPAHPSVIHLLAEAIERAPQAPAMVDGTRRLDYAGVGRCVGAGVSWLRSQRVRPGDRVALIAENSIDCALAFHVLHAARAQAVPINPAYTARELGEILADAAPSLVLFDAVRRTELAPVLGRLGLKGQGIGVGALELDQWQTRADASLPDDLPAPDDLATLQYTGGTTGRPKGVNITHGQMAVNIAQREAALPTQAGDVVLCVMPLFHVFATSMCLHLAANCRGLLVILPRYRPDDVLDVIADHRVTCLPAGPTIIAGLMACERFAQADLASLRAVYSGSAALPEAVLARWERAVGCPIFEGYGQSEAGPVLTYQFVGEPRIPGTVGRALPGTRVEIVDADSGTRVLPPGHDGEVRARGPQIMSGYRDRPAETAAALRDGWLYTGDIGRLDQQGILTISDRKKDMVITGGYNVYPREVEEVLHAHPAVAEAAAVGRPDDYRGEVIVAYVALRTGADADVDGLLGHCRENLARYKVPAEIIFLPRLPRTTVGKLDKPALRTISKQGSA
ncbi:MAG: AMP-binding protein [Burkholderiaceae bacterium]